MYVTAAERRDVLKLFNVTEVARRIGVDPQQLHRDIKAGRTRRPKVRLHKRRYFTAEDLIDLHRCYTEGDKEMNGKRFVVEVWGEEVVHHRRLLTVEVPEDTTEKEIKSLRLDVFEQVPEPPAWELEESGGIFACDEYRPEVIGEARITDRTDARLVRNDEGELVILEK